MSDRGQPNTGKPTFVWPPRDPTVAGSPSPGPAPLPAPSPEVPNHWWQSIERTWLGMTRASFAERIRESGWTPDEPNGYCHRCGGSLLAGQARDVAAAGCSLCREHPTPWTRLVRLGAFEGVLRDGVLEAKFERSSAVMGRLGRMMAESLAGAMLAEGRSPGEAVLVPVPTTWWRTFRRGIDHSGRLAEAVGRVLGIPVAKGLSRRNGRAQVGLSAGARQRNVHRSMRLRNPEAFRRPLVIFVDDVITTGATLRECVRAAGLSGGKGAGAAGPVLGPVVWALVAAAAEGPGWKPLGDGVTG